MTYRNSEIPYYIHEFIGTTIVRLKDALTDPQERFPKIHTVNLLWYNSVLGAELHFTPWGMGRATSPDDIRPENTYLPKLMDLVPLPVPTTEDIELLVENLARSPHTVFALKELEYSNIDTPAEYDTEIRSFTRSLLKIFRDCLCTKGAEAKQAFQKIKELHSHSNELFVSVIHILLGAIPQYEYAQGQFFSKDTIRWVTPDEKLTEWKQMRDRQDPATAMFALLSAVESLQWKKEHHFYVVPNLYKFLKNQGNSIVKRNVLQHALSLSKLSLYITVPSMENEQKEYVLSWIKENLIHWIAQLCSLVRAIHSTNLRHSLQTSDELFNWISQRWARGLLGIAAPEHIDYWQEFLSKDNQKKVHKGRIRRLSPNVLNEPSVTGSPTRIGNSLVNPWGIYEKISLGEEVENSPVPQADASKVSFWHSNNKFAVANCDKGLKTHVNCVLDNEPNNEFKKAVQNPPRFCVADLLHDVFSVSSELGLSASHEWYKRAFGAFYYYFDILRHTEQITSDFETRKKDEPAFYIELFQSLADETQDQLNVLDIGIGYGRLEKALYDEDDSELLSKTTFWGLDISLEMERRHDEYLLERALSEHYKIGEMVEIQEVFGDTKFDVAILAYTTFGCYSSDDKNKSVLEQIAGVLRPGGVLVLEQFNPCLKKSKMPIWPVAKPIDERLVELTKTTNFLPVNDDYTLYAGEYTYNERTPDGPRLIRRDEYCIRLYSESWLKKVLSEIGFDDIKFSADFKKDVVFSGSDEQQMMICVAKKQRYLEERIDPEGKKNLKIASNLLVVLNEESTQEYTKESVMDESSISETLAWLNDKRQLLDGSKAENAAIARKWSSDDRFKEVIRATKTLPNKWKEGNLLANALKGLKEFVMELLSENKGQDRP